MTGKLVQACWTTLAAQRFLPDVAEDGYNGQQQREKSPVNPYQARATTEQVGLVVTELS